MDDLLDGVIIRLLYYYCFFSTQRYWRHSRDDQSLVSLPATAGTAAEEQVLPGALSQRVNSPIHRLERIGSTKCEQNVENTAKKLKFSGSKPEELDKIVKLES